MNTKVERKTRVTTVSEVVTPQKARVWLEKNKNNRPLREAYINYLASAIMAGEWVENGESIKFDTNGDLSDGQHRLWAVIRADRPITTSVARGVAPEAFDTIDRGRARSNCDLLARKGYVSCCVLSGALGWIWKDRHDALLTTGNGRVALRSQQVINLAAELPTMAESIRKVDGAKKIGMPQSVGAFCHYQFAEKDAALADTFFAALADGTNLKAGEPVRELRERIVANKGAVAKLRPITIIALTRKAWNATRLGKSIRCLKWNTDEAMPGVE